MALKTEIFYVDKGEDDARRLNALLATIRRDAVEDVTVVPQANGKTAVYITYEATTFSLLGSSPPDGQAAVGTGTDVILTFDEDLDAAADEALDALEIYEDGALLPQASASVAVSGNRLTVAGLNTAAGVYTQLIVKAALAAASGRSLGRDLVLTWST